MTRFGTVCPARKFRLEAMGNATPVGNAVRKPALLGLVTVTFMTTAETPEAGTPPRADTWRLRVWPWPSLPTGAPGPFRVPRRRLGTGVLRTTALTPVAGTPPCPAT